MRPPLFLLPAITSSRLSAIMLGLALLAGSPGHAQTVYGLGTVTMDYLGNTAGSQGLVVIDPATGVAGSAIPVAGVTARQSLVGLDFRPANGQLYALGYDSVAVAPALNTQLYTLNPSTGNATPVGSAVRLELGRRTARIGFDFNPVADLIRVVSSNRANYRLSPATGAIAGTDTNLAYASGTPATPGIGAVAYTNSFPGAASTTAQAGTGQIQINPSGQIRVDAITNIIPVPVSRSQ